MSPSGVWEARRVSYLASTPVGWCCVTSVLFLMRLSASDARRIRFVLSTACMGGDDALDATLLMAAPALLANLIPHPRNAEERACLQDPTFEHKGHRLEPLGRALVLQLSELLDVSEIYCWELLQRTAADAPGATTN